MGGYLPLQHTALPNCFAHVIKGVRGSRFDLAISCTRSARHYAIEAFTSTALVKLQVLLRREWRTPTGIAEVRRRLTLVGLQPTGSGLATISAETSLEHFESLFGVKAAEIAPRPPSGSDFGRSAGHISPELTVPQPLRDYVESISAAPPHTYAQD
jgi:hypothetical protein